MLLKIITTLIFWGIFIFAVFKVPYPETITQANFIQLGGFFIPLFFALTLTWNIVLKNIFISGSISLGLILLLALRSLNSLNLVTAILIIVAIYLLIGYFRKTRKTNWEIRRIRGIRGTRVKTRNRV